MHTLVGILAQVLFNFIGGCVAVFTMGFCAFSVKRAIDNRSERVFALTWAVISALQAGYMVFALLKY
jgi:hypothetical protein